MHTAHDILQAADAVMHHGGTAYQRSIQIRGRRLDRMTIGELVVLRSGLIEELRRSGVAVADLNLQTRGTRGNR